MVRRACLSAVNKSAIFDNGLPQPHRSQGSQLEGHHPPIWDMRAFCNIPLNHSQRTTEQQSCMEVEAL